MVSLGKCAERAIIGRRRRCSGSRISVVYEPNSASKQETASGELLHSENSRMEKIAAVVAEGTHTAGFTLFDVLPELHASVEAMVEKELLERQIRSGDETFVLDQGLDEIAQSDR